MGAGAPVTDERPRVGGQGEEPDGEPPAPERRPRRAVRPPTNPAADDAPDLAEPSDDGDAERPHDRWLREQRPPHWE